MPTDSKLEKLFARVKTLMDTLILHPKNLQIQNHVNDFYYMQKTEELKLLREGIKETETRLRFLEDNFESAYKQVSQQLRKDIKRVDAVIHSRKIRNAN